MNRLLTLPNRSFGVTAVFVLIVSALIYYGLGFGLVEDSGFAWDEQMMLALNEMRQPWLNNFFLFVTRTGDILIVIPVLAMLVYLWRRGEWITAVLYGASVVAFPLISLIVKNDFARPRQEIIPPLTVEHTYSFPSGHTLTAIAVYGLAAILLWQRGHRKLAILSGFWTFMIGLSRVYLGAHYPSDVLASFASGIILLILVLFADRQLNKFWQQRKNAN